MKYFLRITSIALLILTMTSCTSSETIISDPIDVKAPEGFLKKYYNDAISEDVQKAYEVSDKKVNINTFLTWYIDTVEATVSDFKEVEELTYNYTLTLKESEREKVYDVTTTLKSYFDHTIENSSFERIISKKNPEFFDPTDYSSLYFFERDSNILYFRDGNEYLYDLYLHTADGRDVKILSDLPRNSLDGEYVGFFNTNNPDVVVLKSGEGQQSDFRNITNNYINLREEKSFFKAGEIYRSSNSLNRSSIHLYDKEGKFINIAPALSPVCVSGKRYQWSKVKYRNKPITVFNPPIDIYCSRDRDGNDKWVPEPVLRITSISPKYDHTYIGVYNEYAPLKNLIFSNSTEELKVGLRREKGIVIDDERVTGSDINNYREYRLSLRK